MVSLQKFGRVFVLTLLGDGDQHRFTEALCKAIMEALETVKISSDAGALVITSEGKYFSNGIGMDLVTRLRADSNELVKLPKHNFRKLIVTLVNINVPTIAAICGHASGGGFIFAMAHDHRCMRRDRGYLYMSEMDVKVRIPREQMTLLRATLNPKAFKDTILLAKKHTADDAFAMGILDSVHESSAKTLEAAIAWASELSAQHWDRDFYRNMRLDMNQELSEVLVLDESKPMYKQHRAKL